MGNEFKKTQLRTIILFSTLILGISLYIVLLLTGRSNIFMRENAASLISASNRQMELNIDSYLTKVEKASALLFLTVPIIPITPQIKTRIRIRSFRFPMKSMTISQI